MEIKLIVFDLAGTNVHDDDNVHHALINTMKQIGIILTIDEVNEKLGIPKPIVIKQILENKNSGSEDVNESFILKLHQDFENEMVNFYRNHPTVNEKEGVFDTFKWLKSHGIKITVDTGFNRKITDVVLQRMIWLNHDLIDSSVTSDDVKYGRPSPDLIYKAMALTQVNNLQQVSKLGDTGADILEGQNVACKYATAVTSGAFKASILKQFQPNFLIDKIEGLLPILNLN